MYMNILATAIGSPPPKLRELELNQHQAQGHRSKPVNSFSGIPMKEKPPPKLPHPEIHRVTAATWHIDAYSNTWAPSVAFLREQGEHCR